MTMWLIAGLTLGLGIAVEALSKRPGADDPLLRLSLAAPIRVLFRVAEVLIGWGGVTLVLLTLLPVFEVAELRADPVGWCGAGISLAALSFVLQSIRRRTDVAVAREGIYLCGWFLDWSVIEDVRIVDRELLISTPGVRRIWNGWMGRTVVPLMIWGVPPGVDLELQHHFRAATGR